MLFHLQELAGVCLRNLMVVLTTVRPGVLLMKMATKRRWDGKNAQEVNFGRYQHVTELWWRFHLNDSTQSGRQLKRLLYREPWDTQYAFTDDFELRANAGFSCRQIDLYRRRSSMSVCLGYCGESSRGVINGEAYAGRPTHDI